MTLLAINDGVVSRQSNVQYMNKKALIIHNRVFNIFNRGVVWRVETETGDGDAKGGGPWCTGIGALAFAPYLDLLIGLVGWCMVGWLVGRWVGGLVGWLVGRAGETGRDGGGGTQGIVAISAVLLNVDQSQIPTSIRLKTASPLQHTMATQSIGNELKCRTKVN